MAPKPRSSPPIAVSSLLLLGTLFCTFGTSGCYGPSCKSACEKAFDECAFGGANPDLSIEEQRTDCVLACSQSISQPSLETEAVGWVACVEDFACDPRDEGIPLCLECQSGYYIGLTSGSACSYAEDVAPDFSSSERN